MNLEKMKPSSGDGKVRNQSCRTLGGRAVSLLRYKESRKEDGSLHRGEVSLHRSLIPEQQRQIKWATSFKRAKIERTKTDTAPAAGTDTNLPGLKSILVETAEESLNNRQFCLSNCLPTY